MHVNTTIDKTTPLSWEGASAGRKTTTIQSTLDRVSAWAATTGKVILGTVALYINPTFFCMGIALTVMAPDQHKLLESRLELIHERIDWFKGVALTAIALCASHVTATALAFYSGTEFGTYLIS